MSIPRGLLVSVLCFVGALALSAWRFDPPLTHLVFGIALGVLIGVGAASLAIGIAAVSAQSMQRSIAARLLRDSPQLRHQYPTRSVDPQPIFRRGDVEEVISNYATFRRDERGQ